MPFGYDRTSINATLDVFLSGNLFHLRRSSEGMKSFVFHKKVLSAYESLLSDPAYVDNMAMVTPVDESRIRSAKMIQTVSFDRDQFAQRVTTTLSFIEEIKDDEAAFSGFTDSEVPSRQARFEEELESLRLPCVWKQCALKYQARLEALASQQYLVGAKGVTGIWWENVLSHDLFREAKNTPDHLTPSTTSSII